MNGNNWYFTDCIHKKKNVAMQSDVYELISFKADELIDTIELYVLILF